MDNFFIPPVLVDANGEPLRKGAKCDLLHVMPIAIAGQGGGFTFDGGALPDGSTGKLSRTFSSAGNQKTYVIEACFKRGKEGAQIIFANYTSGTDVAWLYINASDQLYFQDFLTSTNRIEMKTNALFRGFGAAYHIILAVDTTQGTAADRVRLWVNGVEITSWATATYPSLNLDTKINAAAAHTWFNASTSWSNDYWSRCAFYDGLTITDPETDGFGEFVNGGTAWQINDVSGLTFGTNGFLIEGQNVASGTDTSGNGNDFTKTGTITAVNQSPTDSEDASNFATLNPLKDAGSTTYSDGNRQATIGLSKQVVGTLAFDPNDSDGVYFEVEIDTAGAGDRVVGVVSVQQDWAQKDASLSISAGIFWGWNGNGGAFYDGGGSETPSTGNTFTTGDRVGVFVRGYDMWFRKNGTWENSGNPDTPTGEVFTDMGATADALVVPFILGGGASATTATLITDPALYQDAAPTGAKALSTFNLPDAAIQNPSEHFTTLLDTGANIKTASEGEYTYQLAWIKDRDNANNHQLIDTVRGTSNVLQSNSTAAETTYSAPSGNSVAWVWNAANAASSNTNGTITSSVSANTAAGFSIVKWTGTGANATVGHGLNEAPDLMLVKGLDAVVLWAVYDSVNGATNNMHLDNTDATSAEADVWNNTEPTSSVFSIGTDSKVNTNTEEYVAYCWHSVEGYSAFGSYTGNGSSDGPFIYTGFRPAFFLVKRTDSANSWFLTDAVRNPYNEADNWLQAESTNAEADNNTYFWDYVAGGVKMRSGSGGGMNASGGTYIYAAFAEAPLGLEGVNQVRAR